MSSSVANTSFSVAELFESISSEINFLVFFAIGFSMLNLEIGLFKRLFQGGKKKAAKQQLGSKRSQDVREPEGGRPREGGCSKQQVCGWSADSKTIQKEAEAGNTEGVLRAWEQSRSRTSHEDQVLSPEALKCVATALCEVGRSAEVMSLVEQVAKHGRSRTATKAANALLEAAGRSKDMGLLDEIYQQLRVAPNRPGGGGFPTSETYEVLLGGYANAGQVARVSSLMEEVRGAQGKLRLSARAHSVTVKGFLKHKMFMEALGQLREMVDQGFTVPPFALTQILKMAAEQGRLESLLEDLRGGAEQADSAAAVDAGTVAVATTAIAFPAEAVSILFDHGAKAKDLAFLKRAEAIAKESKVPLTYPAYEALVKAHAAAGDARAPGLFEEMRAATLRVTEGTCVGILAHCAEGKQLVLAGKVVAYAREQKQLTLPVYSALMKVYAYSKMYDEACDLYDRILEDGLKPDATMYGCLMKFAVDCGRTELSRKLFERAPATDTQNYMSAIRACGRDRDLPRAMGLLEKMRAKGLAPDVATYNCVMDVCVTVGDLKAARDLMGQIREACGGKKVDVITWNTLLKGHCGSGDLAGARKVLKEMSQEGCAPNEVSYNSLINAFASKGCLEEAWALVREMEQRDVKVDSFTVSTMLKALKHCCRGPRPAEADQVLSLLDRGTIDVCKDEVLLNTSIDILIRLRERERLAQMLRKLRTTSGTLRCSAHTYGLLIKGSAFLRQPEEAKRLWAELTEDRGLTPDHIVFGCMIDALVVNELVEEAVEFFRTWKARIPPNTVMYATLFKGFANNHTGAGGATASGVQRAMEVYAMLKEDRLQMNTVAFNALIDTCARAGATDRIDQLLAEMRAMGVAPDTITYSTTIKGHCMKGDTERAAAVFRSMQEHTVSADAVIYNTILDGCAKHGSYELADELVERMEKEKVVLSNITLTILIKMWGHRNRLDKACELARELPKKHVFRPNKQVATCLIAACIGNRDLAEAMAVFRRMSDTPEFGSGPDARTYGTLISGLSRAGRFQEAVGLVDEAYGLQQGGTSSRKTAAKTAALPCGLEGNALERLLEELARHGEAAKLGMPLVERLWAAKVPVCQRLWTMMMQRSTEEDEKAPSWRSSSTEESRGGVQGAPWRRNKAAPTSSRSNLAAPLPVLRY